jgi:hypothetical protein
MEVVGRPAEVTGLAVRALATVVARVFAVAGEAVGEWGQLALAKHRPWRGTRLAYSMTLQTILSFTIFRTGVSWSLRSVEARDDA